MEQIVIYLLMVQKLLNLKQKILKLQQIHYVNISEDFSIDNLKKTGLVGSVYGVTIYGVSVWCYKYFMKKNGII